jgi:GT2 family glycosyltransferase
MKPSFAIGIPTLNRLDLLHPALLYYLIDFPETKIYIVDNGNQGIDNVIKHENIVVIENETNLGVATSWNTLCETIFENHEYALIMNDDVYFGRTEWEVSSLLEAYPSDLYISQKDFSVFILNREAFKKVGAFDVQFYPAYFEDNDYLYRCQLECIKIHQYPFLNPLVFRNSKTKEKDPNVANYFNVNMFKYKDKWGGLPNSETYKIPYNGSL